MAERQYCKIFRGITLCKFKKKKKWKTDNYANI